MPGAAIVTPVTLARPEVRLEPLGPQHEAALAEAVEDGQLYRLRYTAVPSPAGMATEIARRLRLQDAGTMLPFAVVDPVLDRAVGMTTYMNVDEANRRVEIGSTWIAASVQGRGLNAAAKLLLLAHAFGGLGCIAVELRTHWLNRQSRAAIEKLGAKLDGVLRSHQRMPDGSLRDTCVYSIIASEWPAVRAGLEFRLEG